MHGQERHGDVIDDLCYRLPERQWRYVLGIQRHDDGIAGLDGRTRAEPPGALRDHAAIRAHDIDAPGVRTGGCPAAERDVAITREPRPVEMLGHRLYLADHRDLLLGAWHDQLIAIP